MTLLSHGAKPGFALIAALFLSAGFPRHASAATQCINQNAPNPLEICVQDNGTPAVWVNQPNGRTPQYFANDDWGSVVWLNGTNTANRYTTGYTGVTVVTAVSNVLTGAGTALNPYVITTVVNLGASGVQLTQTFAYVTGDRSVKKRWTLANNGATTFNDLRFFHGGDATFGGDDSARSWYDPTNAMVYVTNQDFTNSGYMGFFANPATPSSRYFGGQYNTGNGQAQSTAQLNNTTNSNYVDAGYYLQWNRASLAPGATWAIEAFETWSPPGALQVLPPANDFVTAGTSVQKIFKVHNLTGGALSVALSAAGAPNGWTASLPNGSPIAVASLQVVDVPVDVTVPSAAAPGTAEDITLTATSGGSSGAAATRLTILQTDYTISPTTLSFTGVAPGATGDLTITLSNAPSASVVQIGTLAASNALAAPFSITADTCSGATVAGGASCSVTVRFSPSNTTPASDTFSWPILAPVITTQTISVSGTAVSSHTVSTSAGANGSINPASAVVNNGSITAFTVTPAAGYHIAGLLGCGGALVGNTYTTGAITSACTVTASFAINQYAATATAGTGGGINPASANVNHGSTTSFTVTPNLGFSIADVSGCGGALTGNTYTTGVITGACAVTASFTLNMYTVSAVADSGGSISPPSVIVSYGSTTNFTVTPAAGSHVSGVNGCGGSLTGNTYTTGAITAGCTVTASFESTPPVFEPASPAPYDLDSTGLLTELPSGIAPQAFDFNGGALAVTLVDAPTRLTPGEHILTWRAVDSRGIESTVQQVLRVWPTVSLGPDVSLGFVAGNSTSFRILLNGAAPQVPFTVAYTASGHPDGHDLDNGSVQFGAGEIEKEVFFAITATPPLGSPSQAVDVELSEDVNRGKRSRLAVHLLAANAAPVVVLSARQGGSVTPVFERGGAAVTILADIRDPNSADTHAVEWISPSGAASTVEDDTLVLQPNSLPAGIHRFEAIVTDGGNPALSTRGVLDIVLAETETPLPTGATEWAENGLPEHVEYNPPLRNVLPEREHDLTQFLIEGDPGLHLSLGPLALEEQRFQAELPVDFIGPDSVTNVGGYFDFIVSDLPAVGQSVRIVMPQRAQIPANPVYRKYDPIAARWKTFVESSADTLASAPGSEGVCPPPGSDEFRLGLNPGDWCVQLTLSDGGANDGDGQANGVVADPGGVGALADVVVTTRGKGGGGAADPLLLLLAAGLFACRKSCRLSLFSAALVASATVSAESAWYAGLQFGPARGDVSESDVNARLAREGYDATATVADLERNAWRVYAGYQLSPRISAELGYTDLGEVTMQLEGNVVDIEEFLTSANALHPHSAEGIEFSLNGRYPLTQRFSVFARGGILRWDSKYRARNSGGEFNRLTDDGTGAIIGAGVEFAVHRRWSVDLDWTHYSVGGESIGFTGVGVSCRFD